MSDPIPRADDVLAIALRLLSLGFSVIPVPRPRVGVPIGVAGDGKVPAIAWREFQSRLPSEKEILSWFGGAPMNLAIVTGEISGVVVVDADNREAVRAAVRTLPYTPWQTRTTRGFHLFYRWPGVRVANRARLDTLDGRLALDVRGDGGYVIAPGSIHASGALYQRAGDWTEPRDRVPVFWQGWLTRPRRPAVVRRADHPSTVVRFDRPRSSDDALGRARAYLAAIPRPEIGSASDAATFNAACRLVRGFGLSADDAEALLWEWCGGRAGWDREWVARKVAHAERYGTEPIGGLVS